MAKDTCVMSLSTQLDNILNILSTFYAALHRSTLVYCLPVELQAIPFTLNGALRPSSVTSRYSHMTMCRVHIVTML